MHDPGFIEALQLLAQSPQPAAPNGLLENWFIKHLINPLGLFGLAAQSVFMLRFIVQWFASEKRGRSYVPVAFWYLSLLGGLMTAVYAYIRKDPVFLLAQLLGLTIYLRNLVLIYSRRARYRQRRSLDGARNPGAVATGEAEDAVA